MSSSSKVRLIPVLLATVVMAACGSSGNSDKQPANTPPVSTAPPATTVPTPAPITTFAEAAKRAETNGSIPVLDRTQTVLGADSNANGIRDDIEQYIGALPDSAAQKQALNQTARAFGAVLAADPKNDTAMTEASAKLSNASSCLFSRYPGADANKRARDMEKFTINTKQRFDAYDAFNAASNGTTSLSPVGDGCEN